MSEMTMRDRVASLDGHIARGTLVREDWGDGVGRACLLAALAPECAATRRAASCPADVMPAWLAHCVPDIDDRGSADVWPWMVTSFAAVARRWHVLDAAAWERVRYRWLGESVLAVAERHAGSATAAVQTVRALCRRAADGGGPTDSEWAAADAAAAAADAAVDAAAGAAAAASWAAGDAAAAAADAAVDAAAAAVGERDEMRAAVAAEAWDEMTAALVGYIGDECFLVEART